MRAGTSRTGAIGRRSQRPVRGAWRRWKRRSTSRNTGTEITQKWRRAMATVFPGRYTAQSEDPFVVFLIGMRINRLLALRSWTRVAAAMIAELKGNAGLGLLEAEFFLYWPSVGLPQYLR